MPTRRAAFNAALLPLLLIAIPVSASRAQYADALREGSRIRVTTPAVKNATGTVKSVNSDSVVIFTEGNGATLALATRDIRDIRLSRGRSMAQGAKRGALWGGAVGVISALVLVGSYGEDYTMGESHTGAVVLPMIASGVFWGAGIGALVKAERWDRARP